MRTTVGVGGFSSEVGKTNLVCELLRALPGWEAIKMTRGHYRSCGKDPRACCVSPLLGEEPVVRSGREETYEAGKDTGKYWEAGAANVHWAIVTDGQVGRGIELALARVRSPGVLVEGNSFLRHVAADFTLMVARPDKLKIKPSARRVLPSVSAFYLSGEGEAARLREDVEAWRASESLGGTAAAAPVYTRADLPRLRALLSQLV